MSGRRVPLSSNQNVANSPLRASAAIKQKRTLMQARREEPYGQPPPAKKQVLDHSTQRVLRSPSQQPRTTRSQIPVQRQNVSSYESKVSKERGSHQQQHQQTETASERKSDLEGIRNWQAHYRQKFPKFVFYFEKVPENERYKLMKQVIALGAKVEPFFSITCTHVVTTRSIPAEKNESSRNEQTASDTTHSHDQDPEQDQVETINPSLLTRLSEASVKRKIFDPQLRARKLQPHVQDEAPKAPQRSMDILLRARDMDKKIWGLEKMQRAVSILLESDLQVAAEIAYSRHSRSRESHTDSQSRTTGGRNLMKLLQNERVNGPSDRDPTVLARELVHFKGPYIYVYDIEEKQRPMMVREYDKVANKVDGAWPQFRTAALGRCPFVDEYDGKEARAREKAKAQAAVAQAQATKAISQSKPVLEPPRMAPPKPVVGKRTLGEMENGYNRGSSMTSIDLSIPARPASSKGPELRANAFTSRAAAGRLFGGEPVASGVQPSNVTSAIRSQMVSSTAATPGLITGLSKEVHGLQRQVLKRNSTTTTQDPSSRRAAETSFRAPDDSAAKRSLTMSRTSSRKLDPIENGTGEKDTKENASRAVHTSHNTGKAKEDMKPGYCENCADKYKDFDEHIESKKHRKFAENDENWLELDSLLAQLERIPKRNVFSSWTPSLPSFEEA
ncbi:Dfp1/Him1, central region-domain-containing protein [Xylariomycetidae sp. FL2044]|nr:Dfp1/Him1, central region-domain-containing protein [Xylariomycetidae sp. FL2044]